MLTVIILLIVTYIMYRFFISRLRWRLLRFGIAIPVFALIASAALLLQGVNSIRASIENDRDALEILDAATVELADLRVTVSSTGQVVAQRQTPLAFQVSAPVAEVLADIGERVEAGEIIARLDATDQRQALTDAEIALNFQASVVSNLTVPPREIDLAAAEAALDVAMAQVYAAGASGPDAAQSEIARLQSEIARNRLWQVQLARDLVSDTELQPPPVIPGDTGVDIVDSTAGDINSVLQAQYRAQLDSLNSQLRQAETTVEQAEFGVSIADENLAATQNRGADPGAVASANAARVQAELALENLLDGPDALQLRLANLDLEQVGYSVELASYNLEQTVLRAPFAGLIAQNNLVVGQLPPQGIGVLIVDDSELYVELAVDETDVVQLQVGQPVVLRADALPDSELKGEVDWVAYTPNQAGQLITYRVRVLLSDPEQPVRVGMSVNAEVVVQEQRGVITVPNRFIRFDRITRDAFVNVQLRNGQVEERQIRLGQRGDIVSQVLEGLDVGERVVLVSRQTEEGLGLLGNGNN